MYALYLPTNQIIFDFHGRMFPEWLVFMFPTKKDHVGETHLDGSSSLGELIFSPRGLSYNFPQDQLSC